MCPSVRRWSRRYLGGTNPLELLRKTFAADGEFLLNTTLLFDTKPAWFGVAVLNALAGLAPPDFMMLPFNFVFVPMVVPDGRFDVPLFGTNTPPG